ncbi:MAG: hypothetical protein KDA88_05295 [Planctomycetaceae bacterium]|nr:hypothetical protein [Planctomycetaceae bacterium]MCB9949716.1 hypothetical protein [Planctomycetaceae bacterium]
MAYWSLRLYGLDEKELWESVKKGAYPATTTAKKFDNAIDPDFLLSLARECFTNSKERRTAITEKCKTLFNFSSILLGMIGLLLPQMLTFTSVWFRLPVILAVLLLVNSITLLLSFFSVGAETEIDFGPTDTEKPANEWKTALASDYMNAKADMDSRTDYLVNVYEAVRFFFMSAFFIVVAVFAMSYVSQSPSDLTEAVKESLMQDREFLEQFKVVDDEQHEASPNPN